MDFERKPNGDYGDFGSMRPLSRRKQTLVIAETIESDWASALPIENEDFTDDSGSNWPISRETDLSVDSTDAD